jgi:hypothetical protein
MPPRLFSIFTGGMPTITPGAGSSFIPHPDRWVLFGADVEMGNLMTLPERMDESMHVHLTIRLGEVSKAVVELAKSKLKRKPDDVITPDGNIYGLDTGLMHDTLTAVLVTELEASHIVAYDLMSDGADYWMWVEFGHMLRNGTWWPGYRFLATSVEEMLPAIRQAVRMAWSDTLFDLAGEARVGGLIGGAIGAVV